MLKALFVQPVGASLSTLETIFKQQNFKSFGVKRFNYPLGLLHMSSILERNNFKTRLLDLDRAVFYYANDPAVREKNLEQFLNENLIKTVREYQPDVIGFSGNYNTNARFIEHCCSEVNKNSKDIKIVVGGHYYTNSYKEALGKETGIDYVVLGEGEQTMLDIANAILKKDEGSLDQHIHVVTRNNILNDSFKNKTRAIVDMESLPALDYSKLEDVDDYLTSRHDMKTILSRDDTTRAVAYMTSRGCPHSCTYCASYQVHGKKMRAFSVDRVIEEFEDMVNKYDVNTIVFEDDLFSYSQKRTVELCKKIWERFGDRFYLDFPNGIAVYTLSEEVVYWMAKAGMKQINVAIESGNQYVQDHIIKKRIKLETVKPVVDRLKRNGVLVRAYFIMGFPGETIEMMRDTKNFAKNLKLDWAVFSFATPIVGSELYETAKRDGYIVADDLDSSNYSDFRLKSADWGPDDVIEMQEEANYEVNFLENYNLVEGNYERSKLIFLDIINDYPKHIVAHYCFWKSLKGLGDEAEALKTEETLKALVAGNEKSIALLKKYKLLGGAPFTGFWAAV